jgi:hypothetical protein
MSILDGVDTLIDSWCGLSEGSRYGNAGNPGYFSRQAAIDLSKHKGPLDSSGIPADTTKLFKQILECVAQNHKGAGGTDPGDSVWRLRKECELSPANESAEVVLERLVVILLGDTWSNQVVAASGLVPGRDRRRSIDLVHKCGDKEFEFIELKYGTKDQGYGSNNPLYAAWEVVIYGLLYVYARLYLPSTPGKPLLQATKVRLVVLAPEGYYRFNERGGPVETFDLAWLENAINKGLGNVEVPGLTLSFEFQKLTQTFEAIYNEPQSLPIAVQAFRENDLRCRERLYGG